MALTTQLDLILKGVLTAAGPLGNTKEEVLPVDAGDRLANGTSANQADKVYAVSGTISSGTPLDLDLTALTDVFGVAVNMAEVVGFLLRNKSTTATQTLTVGNAASNAWVAWQSGTTPAVVIGPEGCLLWWSPSDGAAVTGTTKVLRIAASAASVAYEFIIFGRSA